MRGQGHERDVRVNEVNSSSDVGVVGGHTPVDQSVDVYLNTYLLTGSKQAPTGE